MTIGVAWVGTRPDGREYLWMASDSRTRGSFVLDSSPKLLPLSRSDCAICFAGDTAASYPLMMQLSAAIAAHQPARERSLDICSLKDHLLDVFTGMTNGVIDRVDPLTSSDAEFLFGGYSWRNRGFELWKISYEPKHKRFSARPTGAFHARLPKAAFVGDRAVDARRRLIAKLRDETRGSSLAYLQPFEVVAEMLREADSDATIGGPPQLLRISAHMNTRPLCVRWKGDVTLFGRLLFDHENVDYWIVDSDTLKAEIPRKFGHR